MENCRARRISTALAGSMPCSANAPASTANVNLMRIWILPAAVDLLFLPAAADAVRLPADIGVDRQRADFRPLRALGIEAVELVDRALEQVIALVMLDQHHR